MARQNFYEQQQRDNVRLQRSPYQDNRVRQASTPMPPPPRFEEEEDLDERRARGRDREGMEPDERRRPMQEAVLRERIRALLKNVKFKK